MKFHNKQRPKPSSASQLHRIINDPDFLARFERRKSNIRAAIAAECIAERATIARACLALHREVYLVV